MIFERTLLPAFPVMTSGQIPIINLTDPKTLYSFVTTDTGEVVFCQENKSPL
jgi:hypothetical protein